MPYFKDPYNGLHFLDGVSFSHLLPEGSTPVTDGEAVALPTQPPVQPQIPSQVTRFQALAALLQAGLLPDVEAYMARPETDPFVALAWKEAQDFRRDSPIVLSLGDVLGLTQSQLDDLFKFASTIGA